MRCLPPWRERVMISCGGGFPRAGRRCVGSEAVDPIGVALSITAGERSHLRTGTPPLIRPHGGRTSCRGRADRGLLRGDHWTGGSLAAPRVCLRPTRGNRRWTPMGSTYPDASFPQVRLWLTRGYRKFAPYGGAGLAVCLTSRRTFCRMGICLRRDAIHRASHVPDGPAAGRNAVAGQCPERVRRDESCLYVADSPCGRERDSREADGLEEAGLCVTSGGA